MKQLVQFRFGVLFFISLTIFLIHYLLAGQAVYGDGIGYYAHLHTWIIDNNFDFNNEYRHVYTPENNNRINPETAPQIQLLGTNSHNQVENFYNPGPALLLSPFYLLAHLLSLIINLLGGQAATQGYADLYQILTGIGAIIYVISGLYLLEKIILFFTHDQTVSTLVAVCFWGATGLLYYGAYDVINSHFASFFLTTLLIYLAWVKLPRPSLCLLSGLVLGALGSTRTQDLVFGLVWLVSYFNWQKTIPAAKKNHLGNLVSFGFGIIMGLMPTLFHAQSIYSNPCSNLYFSWICHPPQPQTIDWLGSLFNPVTGLFPKAPILLLSLISGIGYMIKKREPLIMVLFGCFVLQYLIISMQSGWAAAAYGGRMYISSYLFFALALAELLIRAKLILPRYLLIGGCCLAIILNGLSLLHFVLVEKGAEGGRTGMEQRTKNRIDRLFINSVIRLKLQ